MSDQTDLDTLTKDFLGKIHLADVDVIQISIDLGIAADENYSPESEEIEPEFAVAIDTHDEVNKARFRVKAHIEFPRTADLVVELGAVYDLGDARLEELDDAVITNFLNKVVMMTLFPYLRAEVAYLTSRAFNTPLTLPILEHGDIVFGE